MADKSGKSKGWLLVLLPYVIELVKKFGPKVWKHIKAYWNEKQIAVLGATASGKNSLLARLQNKNIPAIHVTTEGAEPVPSFRVDYPDGQGGEICFNVKEGLNVDGKDESIDTYWEDACKGANVIFYLIDAEVLSKSLEHNNIENIDDARRNNPLLKRLYRDMCFIAGTVSGTDMKLAVILNKIDLPLSSFSGSLEDKLKAYAPQLRDMINLVDQIAKKGLGAQAQCLKTVSPLSCKDSELFSQLFPNILKNVAGA